ncbi:lipopolysaccharide biosynthesis protein [Chitinophaga japonensis]|uniref:O-antigen/teichoic acid export membrane protein n=1 Tax=Chitinophaga japonensis TaxID=104662 RepID=A0A562T010_CHIJA|nr:oligosaccharide flippase family protein [Chitinophaga japonensis]TWI86879.1 O-antigen/teichoic acid export membrane protein [Chitinophaga japonensis]
MGTIRKQSIVSSIIIYTGFVIGALNTWFFASHYFTPEQYGLTRVLLDITQTLFVLANIGAVPVMYRFYPYYRDWLPMQRRDLFGKTTLISLAGFVCVSIALFAFKDLYIRKFMGNSPMLVRYFYAIYPFTFFLLIFSLLEAQAWNHFSSLAANFFKELGQRLFTTFLIILFILHWLNFDQFITVYSLLYGVSAVCLLIYLVRKNQISFTIKTSVITRRLYKKMLPFGLFVFLVSLCTMVSRTFDGIIISSLLGLSYAGIFTFASYITSLLEAPQRGLIAASVPVIAQAWKDKDLGRISRIYQKSSINMLLFSGFLFGLIWLNLHNAVIIFRINPEFMRAETVLLLLGLSKVIELGTGVNAQILGTSRYWKMDLGTNVILIITLIPLNYLLIKKWGINGSALATLIAFFIFNVIRFTLIWVKFKMQPFTWRTLAAIGVLLSSYAIAHYLVHIDIPLLEAVVQSILYATVSLLLIVKLQVSEDINHLAETTLQKLKGFFSRNM